MKNIDVICTIFEVFDKQLNIKNNRKDYHLPVDNYILKALWNRYKKRKLTVDLFPKKDLSMMLVEKIKNDINLKYINQ